MEAAIPGSAMALRILYPPPANDPDFIEATASRSSRDVISERTREGLARARSSGRKLGRPKGSLGVSRLDGKEDEDRRVEIPDDAAA